MITSDDSQATREYWLDTTFAPVDAEPPTSADDFGGQRSHMLCLKRKDIQPTDDGHFGRYWGAHDGKEIVGLQPATRSRWIGFEAFDSLAELKQRWWLD